MDRRPSPGLRNLSAGEIRRPRSCWRRDALGEMADYRRSRVELGVAVQRIVRSMDDGREAALQLLTTSVKAIERSCMDMRGHRDSAGGGSSLSSVAGVVLGSGSNPYCRKREVSRLLPDRRDLAARGIDLWERAARRFLVLRSERGAIPCDTPILTSRRPLPRRWCGTGSSIDRHGACHLERDHAMRSLGGHPQRFRGGSDPA